jgi:phosphoribosylglycinamide formyltransferase 1
MVKMLLNLAGCHRFLSDIPPFTRLAILASGNGSNAETLIQAVHSGLILQPVVLVLSDTMGARVLEKAHNLGVKTSMLTNDGYPKRRHYDEALDSILKDNGVDFVILAGFMRLLSRWFVDRWAGRVMNIHPSLLPSFKGAHSIQDALDAKVSITGCTVHLVTPEMDSGPILGQAAVPVLYNDTIKTLAMRIHQAEHLLYPKVLKIVSRS